jgi:hypothetical protein
MSQQTPIAKKDYSPTGNQQQPAVPKPIAQPDDQAISSAGNQAIKEAVEQLHPKDLARNLDPNQPAAHPAKANEAPPFAGYATGKVPDTAKGADSE